MNHACLKCGEVAEQRFRPVMGHGRMERLCPTCADGLSTLVRAAGETCRLSLADARFAAWLETGLWSTDDGRTVSLEEIPAGWHGAECACCAAFAEEDA